MFRDEQSGGWYLGQVPTVLTLVLLYCFPPFADSRVLSEEGYGKNVEAARNEALSSLAVGIFVHIESNSQSYEDNKGENRFSSTTRSSTDLPLIGVDFDCYAALEQQLCVASLDTESSLNWYQAKIKELVKDIDQRQGAVSQVSPDRRYDYLLDTLSRYEEHERYATVLLKVNKPGYFFVAGHIKNEENELSYLLDLADAPDDRRFVYFVNADEVNKWVSLGNFVVHPPYGIESLQVLASRNDLVDRLPAYTYDPDSEYYVLSGNIENSVAKTRGLKRKKLDTNNVEPTSEAVLLFTTRKK